MYCPECLRFSARVVVFTSLIVFRFVPSMIVARVFTWFLGKYVHDMFVVLLLFLEFVNSHKESPAVSVLKVIRRAWSKHWPCGRDPCCFACIYDGRFMSRLVPHAAMSSCNIQFAPSGAFHIALILVAHDYRRRCPRWVSARLAAGARLHIYHFSRPSTPLFSIGPVGVRVGQSAPLSASLGGSARTGWAPGPSSARSFSVGSSVGSDAGQSPGMRTGVLRSSPLSLPAPPVRILPDPSRPVHGRRSGSSAGHPVCTCCIAGFRCSVFLSVLSISHSYLVVFMCSAWDFGALSGSFCQLWTELTLERPFTAPS
ncbi:hypothetical protein NDU88_001418 [Pleurodeles waltl]|uniref:Uncharacterized protein n=1 Tax=Pleurodeles waltl TaxID=8319 RepID=A0AAV7NFP8_PLEWA|nr:hypothetical protein NDU88_001418 [Pleurodeles waltl]